MADREITAAMSAVSMSDAPRLPRPNFPLPRELRDQIYGYLLDNQYTRLERTFHSAADKAPSERGCKTYHFHTNILAVNREIHDEAEKLLYERNIFVVVSCQFPALVPAVRSTVYFPVVTETHASRMRHHSLRVHLKAHGPAANTVLEGDKPPRTQVENTINSAVLLHDHLQVFCNLAGLTLSNNPPQSLVINIAEKSYIGRLPSVDVKAPRLSCELRSTRYREMTPEVQTFLLAPLAGAISHNLVSSFTGTVCNPQEIIELQKLLGPTLVTFDAHCWAQQEISAILLDVAHDAVQHGELDLAERLYSEIVSSFSDMIRDFSAHEFTAEYRRKVLVSMMIPYMKSLICVTWLRLKMGKRDALKESAYRLVRFLGGDPSEQKEVSDLLPPEITAHAAHVVFLALLHLPPLDSKPLRMSVAGAVNYLASSGDDYPHIVHDRTILANFAEQRAALTQAHLPFKDCSISVLNPPGFPQCK
ncbi:hypothetical protein Q7P37_011142 [Cladosporium fusiforme]